MDLVVEDQVVLELKTVEVLLPVHTAQLLTYLKLSGKPIGLLMNFNTAILTKGLKRVVNNYPENSASRRLGGENDAPTIP
jgi:GxxExxY protein